VTILAAGPIFSWVGGFRARIPTFLATDRLERVRTWEANMVFLAVVGLWAMWRGSITITESLRVEGRQARLYGVTLLASSVALLLLAPALQSVLPGAVQQNAGARIAVQAAIVAVLIIGLALPFRSRDGAR
jgi:hypothetical protein